MADLRCKLDVAGEELVGLTVPRFDPRDVIPPTRATLRDPSLCRGGVKILVVGAPGSGKSYFIRWLMLSKAATIPTFVVVSGTEASTGFYSKFVPPAFVYHEYGDDVVRRVVNRQKRLNSEKGRAPWLMLVVDDCASSLKTMKGDSLKLQEDLLKNGRHWKMDYVVGVQDLMDIKASLRTSFDYVVLFGITNQQRRRTAAEMLGTAFLTQEMFFDVYDAVTRTKHRALVVRNNTQDLTEAVMWSQAPRRLPDVKLGSAEYRCYGRAALDEKLNAAILGLPAASDEVLFSEDEGGEV